jgi:hypothetical protein
MTDSPTVMCTSTHPSVDRSPAGDSVRSLTAHRLGELEIDERLRPVLRPVTGVQVRVVQVHLDESALE